MKGLVFVGILAIVPVCYGYQGQMGDTKHQVKHHHKVAFKHPHRQRHQRTYVQPCRFNAQVINGDEYNQHEPGYFFAEICGTYYPDYQTPRFYKAPYCRFHVCPYTIEDEKYAEVFYRYYDDEGLSREYYYP